MNEPKLSPKDAAAYLEVSIPTLARWRAANKGPAFFNLGGTIRYVAADLDAWVASCRIETGEKQS